MNNSIFMLLISLLLLPIAGEGQTSAGDVLRVELLDAKLRNHALRLTWSLINTGPQALYVYKPFIYGPAAKYRTRDRVLAVGTSLSEKSFLGVNFYSKAEFLKLDPGASVSGTFQDSRLPGSVARVKPNRAMLFIAYGFEIEKLERALKAARSSNEHPANPIVDWQSIAQSNIRTLGSHD